MPFRKLVLLAGVAVALVAMIWLTVGLKPVPKPVPGITIVGYTNTTTKRSGDVFGAVVALLNGGSATMSLRVSPFDGTPYPSIEAETPSGWTNYHMGGMTASRELLRPGSNYVFFAFLPTNASRWKMTFQVSTASIRERAIWNLIEHRSLAPLYPVLGWPLRLLPNTTEYLDVKTRVFEVTDDGESWHNPQGGANGRQPVRSETNRAAAAAASRRSP
jgi:hypothetical protein